MVTTALTTFGLLVVPVHAGNWTGGTGDWFDPANWDSGVPTAGTYSGVDNGGTVQIEAPGAVSQGFSAGFLQGNSGTLEVSGSGASLATTYTIYLGYEGQGFLDISDGGNVTAQAGYLGHLSTGFGELNVDGEGSLFDVSSTLTIGNEGEGRLTVTNGAAVNSGGGSIGQEAGSSGSVTVDGEGSNWYLQSQIAVGYDGQGRLDIANGGSVTGGPIVYLGARTGSMGTVTVDGEGSMLVAGTLLVGYLGDGTLDISGGAVVENTYGYIGYFDSNTSIVTVDGTGSTWTNDGDLHVGYFGTGMLNITGGGTVNSASANTFAGHLQGSSGTITVDGEGSAWTGSGDLYLGYMGTSSLTVANGASVSFNYIGVASANDVAGTINIGAAMGEAAVGAGTIDAPLIGFGAGTGSLVFNHTDTDYVFGARINGLSGTLRVLEGSTTLSGNSSTFQGTTTVEGGALIVNGSLGGSIDVADARLGGSGTIGSTVLGAGAVIAPGNSAGTLTVDGNLTFHADSTYEVEVDTSSNTSDLIHVTGTAWLNGASVAHVGLTGSYPWYMTRTILTADGGIDGTFGGITSDFAFLTPDLAYDANNVRMTLLRNDVDFTEVSQSPNQTGVASAANGLGQGNPIYDEILTMTEAEARAAFDALSGEAYASAGSAAFNAAQQLRDLLQIRLQMFSGAKVASAGFVPAAGDRSMADAAAIWGQVFGSEGTSDATATSARLDRRSAGFIGGADKSVGEDTRVGFALGYSRSNFDVSSLISTGGSDNFHLMGYAGTKLGAVDLGATLGYSYGRADAERTVIVGGLTENLIADYDSHTFQASVEAGTDFDMGPVVLTPFAGLAVTHVETGSFTETGGLSALSFASSSNTTGLSTLGLRVSRETGGVTLAGSAAWRHAFGDVEPVSRAAFASAPASPFSVRGTAVSEDALALEAGIGLRLDEGTLLTLGYSGEYASGSRDNGLKAELRVEF